MDLTKGTATYINFGPLVLASDGATPITISDISEATLDAGIHISKNGAAYGARNTATGCSFDIHGNYRVHLDATDTNTLGILKVLFVSATDLCLPHWEVFNVKNSATTGVRTYTYTITNANTAAPLEGVYVVFTNDSAGLNPLVSGYTNSSGQLVVSLNDGTVYAWAYKSGFNFVNPESETVSVSVTTGTKTGTPVGAVMPITNIHYPVHYALGQDPALGTTSYVTTAEMSYFAQTAIRLLSKYAQAYPVVGAITMVNGQNTYPIPTTGTTATLVTAKSIGGTLAAAQDCEAGPVRNVIYIGNATAIDTSAEWASIYNASSQGVSLKRVDQDTVGQMYYPATVGTDEPLFYSQHGSNIITIYPALTTATNKYLLIYFDGIPNGGSVDITDASKVYLDEDWYDAIITYCIAKGKEKYQQFEQAKYYMDQFTAILNKDGQAVEIAGAPKPNA